MTLPVESTPTALTPKISEFCRSIAPNEQAVFVQVQPCDGAGRAYFLENVARYAAQFGGSVVLGWCIWERPAINLHAEVHAVWKSPGGEFLDVSPTTETKILFLPDPKVGEGKTSNRFLPLMHWREIQDYLAANSGTASRAELKRAVTALEKRLGRSK